MKNKTKKIWHPEMWIAFFAICGFLVVLSVANATYITTALRPLNVGLPTANTNAATKAYVDTAVAAVASGNTVTQATTTASMAPVGCEAACAVKGEGGWRFANAIETDIVARTVNHFNVETGANTYLYFNQCYGYYSTSMLVYCKATSAINFSASNNPAAFVYNTITNPMNNPYPCLCVK